MLARDEHIRRPTDAVLLAAFGGDAAAKAAVADAEKAQAARRERVKAENEVCAAQLGINMDQVQQLVSWLAGDVHLWSWLQSRVNWTLCHDRPLAHDE
jgi:hypothetical protein